MYCHRNDTAPDLVCTPSDAALPVDATRADAPANGADAAIDAAAADAGDDAAVIVAPDAAAPGPTRNRSSMFSP